MYFILPWFICIKTGPMNKDRRVVFPWELQYWWIPMPCWDLSLHLRERLNRGQCCWSPSSPCSLSTRIPPKAFSQQFMVVSFTHYFLQRRVGPGIHVPTSSHKSEPQAQIVCGAEEGVDSSSAKKLLSSYFWGVKPGWTQCTAPSGTWEDWELWGSCPNSGI